MPTGPILIVEDQDDSRDLLAQMLAMWGYAVATTATGDEAIAWLDGGLCPRLMMLDLMLPNTSGWTVMERLRADPRLRHIPVIVVTAVTGEMLRRNPVDADAIIRKPFDYEELQQTVRRFAGDP